MICLRPVSELSLNNLGPPLSFRSTSTRIPRRRRVEGNWMDANVVLNTLTVFASASISSGCTINEWPPSGRAEPDGRLRGGALGGVAIRIM